MALENLNQFTGSENYFRHGIVRNFIYTDGVKYVADEAGAYWLIDEIALANKFDIKLKGEDFQTWKLTVNDSKAALVCTDGNNHILISKEIPFTDFPADHIDFYVVSAEDFGEGVRMMMLPSEY